MNDPATALTAFDAIVFGVIALSALMGFARGFRRELATFAAFTLAVTFAVILQVNYGTTIEDRLPFLQGLTPFYAGLVISAFLFIILYGIFVLIGSRFANIVQGLEDVGPLDRFGGVLFGIGRAVIVLVLLTVLIRYFGVDERLPNWITNSHSYPPLANAAKAVQIQAPEIADRVQSSVPPAQGSDTAE